MISLTSFTFQWSDVPQCTSIICNYSNITVNAESCQGIYSIRIEPVCYNVLNYCEWLHGTESFEKTVTKYSV